MYRSGSVVFDIETIPTQRENIIDDLSREFHKTFKISKSITKNEIGDILNLDEETIKSNTHARLLEMYAPIAAEKSFDKLYRDTALDGGLGEIVSIGWTTINEEGPFCITRKKDESERDLIANFSENLSLVRADGFRSKEIYFIGHNIGGMILNSYGSDMLSITLSLLLK